MGTAAEVAGGSQMGEQVSGRILLVDDEALIRMGLRAMLHDLGYTVVGEAGNGREAVEKVVALNPDIVIMDIKMPEMDGLEATRRIMATHPVPIIVLTAYNQRNLVDEAADIGVLAYLTKPVREPDILPAIEVARARFADLQWLSRSVIDRQNHDRPDAAQSVEVATRLLSIRYQLPETQAAARLRRLAQKTRRTIAEVAAAIIELEHE